ncbi:actin-like ATPase domain-containing protein [Aspergillus caelatus]|uniref:Actin-like ATPase domain-containing protein n=1 Tax=Aspergillus caelatus TaxID=61420 RepID=A0A5N7APT0_9EURO|nr:actin-like ATPase domain-containing protein [Aspergillus caelatus]KAE8370730.1 actin-like ATPase domain-containing protein [Aspergillus caelatus]
MTLDSNFTVNFSSLALSSNRKIIVGVDYGTTYTGASYVSSKASGLSDIILINTWPGPSKNTDAVYKAPSRIAYASDNPRISLQRWGYQVEPGMVAYSWTKLLLDQGTPLSDYDDSSLENASQAGIMRVPEGKTAVDVVSDYLSEIYKHILKAISKHITEQELHVTPIEFWFTVPAIWSDKARDATRTAARRAGFGGSLSRQSDKVFLISEPEAAAITALKKYTTNSIGGSVKVGDGVLVCDCGGGTVDITTYVVNRVSPSLEFEELCTGIGGKCGSTAVDRNFYKLMSDRFGDAFNNLPMKRKSPGSEFMKQFETVKRDFGSSDELTTFELPLNMTVSNADPEHFDEEERIVIISSNDLRTIFEPVIEKIISLVRRQIEDAHEEIGKDIINRIILVGGFGDSEYLRKSFRSSFEAEGKITVTIPDAPQAAIVQGAALRGLEGLQSTTKRCRRHYGFCYGIPFRDGIDNESDAYVHPYSGTKMVAGIMKWMIAKGDKYEEDYTESIALRRPHTASWGRKKSITLYACDQASAPERVNCKDVYEVGDIVVDFTGVDLQQFDSKMKDGRRMYNLTYDVKVIFGAQEGVLKFEAVSQGQTIGRTSINFATIEYY